MFLTTSLEIKTASKSTTLVECLEKFTTPEKLDNNTYICSECSGQSHDASKHLSIKVLPPVLSIQLKRFKHTSATEYVKNESVVSVPTILDMTPFTSTSFVKRTAERPDVEKGRRVSTSAEEYYKIRNFDEGMGDVRLPAYRYKLFAVVHHMGKIGTGHYTCCVGRRDKWYLIDDETITEVDEARVGRDAYLLFYMREFVEFSAGSGKEVARVKEDGGLEGGIKEEMG
jgi:ubiquitin carboxyl-terminal hydrolase 22/27/51